MRLAPPVLALVVLVGACGQDDPTVEIDAGTPNPTTPAELPGATCDEVTGGNGRNLPDFVDVEVESEEAVDRVTFRFEPRNPSAKKAPWHTIRFTEELNTDPEGSPADIEGDAFVLVVFGAFGVDLSGEEFEEIYTGPKEFTPGFGTVREVEQLGDFEATVSWGIGLSRQACYVVDTGPDHLTLEFPSS